MKEKNNKSKYISIIINIILVAIVIALLIDKNIIIGKEKQIIKEMTQSENEANLQTQINTLNASHNEYSLSVQKFKKELADYIEGKNVSRPEREENASAYINRFEEILAAAIKENSKQAEPYIKDFNMGYYQDISWSYKRITPVLTINPNGCSSFTISQFGMQVAGVQYYFSISSVTNGTFDGLTVYPIDKNADVVVTFDTMSVTILNGNVSYGSCYIVSYE